LWKVVNCGSHDLVLGEVVQVHIDESILKDNNDELDPSKLNPLLSYQMEYWDLDKSYGEWGSIWNKKE